MDQLVRKLTEVLQVHYGARLVNTSMTTSQPYDPIMTMGGSVVQQYMYPTTTEIHMTVKESETRLFYEALRTGMFQELMGHSARIVRMSTEMTGHRATTTTVDIIMGDIDELVANIEKYAWEAYDKQFNDLIKETLTDQV